MGRTACTEPQCLYKGDLYLVTLLFFKEVTSVLNARQKKFPHYFEKHLKNFRVT